MGTWGGKTPGHCLHACTMTFAQDILALILVDMCQLMIVNKTLQQNFQLNLIAETCSVYNKYMYMHFSDCIVQKYFEKHAKYHHKHE